MEANKVETELEQKILRKDAELMKASNQEDVTIHQLTVHKLKTKEDRKKMEDEKRVCYYTYVEICKERDGVFACTVEE